MRLFVALGLVLVLVGCAGTLDDQERFATSKGDAGGAVPTAATSCDAVAVLREKCAGCHEGKSPSGGLDLVSPDLPARIRSQPAKGGAGLLLDPSAPKASVLATKLGATPTFGGAMPPGALLTPETVTCIEDWLATNAR